MFSRIAVQIVRVFGNSVQPSTNGVCCRCYTYKPLYNLKILQTHIVYPTLQSVLDVLNNEKYKDDEDVSKLLQIYLKVKSETRNAIKIHPLIVLEGLDLSGKSTLVRVLASQINAKTFRTPPSCIDQALRDAFEAKSDLRSAFYSMGNYIAALQMLSTLEKSPVVLDRFWHSTAAHALALAVQQSPNDTQLPARGATVYQWPSDLLKPDAVFLLAVSEDERLRRHCRRKMITKDEELLKNNHKFRQNVLLAYQYMNDPSVNVINGDPPVDIVLKSLQTAIKHLIPGN